MIANNLKSGDCVGVCAPSGIIKNTHSTELKRSEKFFNEYGISVKYSKNLYANTLGYSATVKDKVDDLNSLIRDKQIKAIVFAKGGNNSNSILDYIDYEAIKNNPKIFMGFSDITILLNAIYKMTGLVTYHFTNFKGFCSGNEVFNRHQFEEAFLNKLIGNAEKLSNWQVIRHGCASGKLVGGNVNTLVKLIGTKYCPRFDNKILFIEAFGMEHSAEEVMSVIYQLKQNGVFNKINGLIIGNYDNSYNYKLENIVLEVVNDSTFPIIKCNDFGHTTTNMVLPIGLQCSINTSDCSLCFKQKLTK